MTVEGRVILISTFCVDVNALVSSPEASRRVKPKLIRVSSVSPVPMRTAEELSHSIVAASVAAAEAVGAMTKVMKPAAKAPAATPASTRLPVRIALDNAFPFVNARPLFGPPGAEGSISDVPGRNERQTR